MRNVANKADEMRAVTTPHIYIRYSFFPELSCIIAQTVNNKDGSN